MGTPRETLESPSPSVDYYVSHRHDQTFDKKSTGGGLVMGGDWGAGGGKGRSVVDT